MKRAARGAAWPVVLLVLSFLCPTEFSVYAGSIRLPPHRALLIVLLPIALFRALNSGDNRLKLFDITIFLFAVWVFLAHVYNHGLSDGIQPGGSQALDAFASSLVARVYIRTPEDFRSVARLLFYLVAIIAVMALPEALTGHFYIHEFLGKVTGYIHPTGVETRMHLTRAFATFDHPIHLGTFCAAGLAICVYSERNKLIQASRIAMLSFGAFLGLSSAPMLAIAVQFALMATEKLTRGLKGRIQLGFAVITG
ncbi:MAG: hypothetical protein ACK5JT_11430, partial [Hyphomicrobiaceae bacterium]